MDFSELPDNVLLDIFDFCRKNYSNHSSNFPVWEWHILVHVCRRWRQIVFASPLRLELRILCTSRTPVRKNLDIWPALPISVDYDPSHYWTRGNNVSNEEDNIITALEHFDRVCDVSLAVTGSELEKIIPVMKKPFPELTSLSIWLEDGNPPILPVEFLGASAPCLQSIYLGGISFPALPMLLLSTSNLVFLDLREIPPTGYISPEAMVAGLTALPKLKSFIIEFQLATPRPDRIHPPPVTWTVLPALTSFRFKGASEYLEDLVAGIDAPQLDEIYIYYLNQLVDFQVAQLSKFIRRSVGPKLTLFNHAKIDFQSYKVMFYTSRLAKNPSPEPKPLPFVTTTILIFCQGIDWQVSHMAQVLNQFSAALSNVVHLKLNLGAHMEDHEVEGTDVEWLHLLHQFSTMRTLHISWRLARHVTLALEDMTAEMVAEAFPSLDLIYIKDQPASSVEKFVAARKLSGRPVTVLDLDAEMEFEERLLSY